MASVDGLVSGLDTTTIISQLMQLERQPQSRLKTKQATVESAIGAAFAMSYRWLPLGAAYLLLHFFASPAIVPMIIIVVLWGATHTSGLIVTQVWLTSEAPEAPEFVTGLYISFINLGVTLGATTGGWFLERLGMQGTILSGLLFCALAAATIAAKVLMYGARPVEPEPETRAVLH